MFDGFSPYAEFGSPNLTIVTELNAAYFSAEGNCKK